MQIKHVSEIKDSELEPIRKLVESYHNADSGGLVARSKKHLVDAVIDLFTIKNNSDEKE